jgi:hypothetical protein
LCIGKNDVYGPDFYEIIRNTFRPIEEYRSNVDKPATFDEVEAKIGAFKTGCEPVRYVASLNPEYFVCNYDLRGDGQFIIGIFYYYPENTVLRIVTPMGED